MSFSFNFSDEDISDDISSKPSEHVVDFHTSIKHAPKPTILPQAHSPNELLSESLGVRMSYTSTPNLPPRRDLFDIKHQLMTQDTLSPTEEILLGLTNEDLRVAEYEGGLKSWECTFDLVQHLQTESKPLSVCLEMGCGTAVPSSYIFSKMYSAAEEELKLGVPVQKRKLIIADYNVSVLKLVSVPNLLFTWFHQQSQYLLSSMPVPTGTTAPKSGEIDISQTLLSSFVSDLSLHNIDIVAVSGGWSEEFVKKVIPYGLFDIILASETIYSPNMLPVFTDTMLNLMSPNTRALVAAKRVYFGVGGGIPEFESELQKRGVRFNTVRHDGTGGVAREILEVVLPH